MNTTDHQILLLNFFVDGPSIIQRFQFEGSNYEVTEHKVGNDFKSATALIKRYDGIVDGIALAGIQKWVSGGQSSFIHPGYQKLMRSASESSIHVADRLRHFFSDWLIQRILKEDENFFRGRKVLFHNAMISPLVNQVVRNGGVFRSADAIMLSGIPRLIGSVQELEIWLKTIYAGMGLAKKLGYEKSILHPTEKTEPLLAKWIKDSDYFFTFGKMIDLMNDLTPLSGKTVFVDYLSDEAKTRLESVDHVKVIEFIPQTLREGFLTSQPLSLLATVLAIESRKRSQFMSYDEFLLRWIQENKHEPSAVPLSSSKVRKCAFILHPLEQSDLWRMDALKPVKKLPASIRMGLETLGSNLPVFKAGTISGIKSASTGQEAECDIYVLAATPKRILEMNENRLYSKLIKGTNLAAKNGAILMGLGAYTKVAGDSGVSVSRGASIAVTNGNSYSAATSLWASELTMDRLGFERTGKAMVIGATGSIGRVSALILAEKFKEIVLVATSLDKLLEMKREILEQNPNVDVKVTTSANSELEGTELILTATSNQTGERLFDIQGVMPGTVICDCSRPFDISRQDALLRPDVIVIQSGEIALPGKIKMNVDIGLPNKAVYACLAETVLLTLDNRIESYSLSKRLSQPKVKEILEIGHKHGAKLSVIRGPLGIVSDEQIEECKRLVHLQKPSLSGLKIDLGESEPSNRADQSHTH